MDDFNTFFNEIPRIEVSTNYWLFRTMGGRLFRSFLDTSVIVLGYPTINEDEAKELIKGKIDEEKRYTVTMRIPSQKRPGLVINTLKRFYTEIKIGDYIIIPGHSCQTIVIGEIISNVERIEGIKVLSRGKEYIDTRFKRSRKVKWLKKAKKGEFSPELYGLFNTHQAISFANGYSHWINNILYSFYETGNIYHYIINVKQKHALGARNLYGMMYDLLSIADTFLKSENINEDTSSINTKISLNSPGYIELFGTVSSAIVVIPILILLINGGGLKIKTNNGFELDLSINGLIKKVNEFLNSRSDRKLKETLARQLSELRIENSSDIVNILEAINQQNQNDK
jgi:hypothetical protein